MRNIKIYAFDAYCFNIDVFFCATKRLVCTWETMWGGVHKLQDAIDIEVLNPQKSIMDHVMI